MKVFFLIFISLFYSQLSIAKTTLIHNIQGYTIEQNQLKQLKAILFTNDKITQVFVEGDPLPKQNSITMIDGQNKTLLPGLIDAHGHVMSYGFSLLQTNLVNSQSEQDAVLKTLKFADKNRTSTWIKGRGWNQVQWENKHFPAAKSLDKYFPTKPVWLERVDGHAGWANSAAMKLSGISKNTPTPPGGEIIKDKNGEPTGIFIDNAMDLITKSISPPSRAEKKAALLKAMQALASYGLTSIHDAGIDHENLTLYKELIKHNKMPIRINAMLYLPSDNWQNILAQGTYKSDNDMLAFNSVKIQADGALGSRGAALINDYSDQHHHKGLLLHNNKALDEYIEIAMLAGFQVNTHAIGDNANKIVLDSYEKLIQKTDTKHLRHRVEHAQILRLTDIPRFSQLGVIASMQATHATSDKNMAIDRIGNERIKGAYAWRKLLKNNTIIAAGSDFPVESPNPFYGIHASITRQDHQNQPNNGWFPEEKMTREEAFNSFTSAAAYSGHQETIIGTLDVGKKADFIILSDNPFSVEESKLWSNKVLETWVNGKRVHKLIE